MIKTYRSFAKINLFLTVLGRRNDGFHDLCSLMTQIDLYDDIHIDFNSKGISVSCLHPDVPEDPSNLVIKAAELFYQTLKKKGQDLHQGLSIKIDKKIPPGGGLGGGSSNAATILMALNEYHNQPFVIEKLMETPVFGRIVALADVFDALSSARVYKEAWCEADVLETIKKESGAQFDPEIVEIFFASLDSLRSIQKRYLDP